MKAIWINTLERTITEVEYAGLPDLNRMIGGSISLAGTTRLGDTVYVHDEGLFLFQDYFELPGCGQGLFAGPGVIVGKEIGMTANTRDYKITLAALQATVIFHDRVSAHRRSRELGI